MQYRIISIFLAVFLIFAGSEFCFSEEVDISSLNDLVIQENIKGTSNNNDGTVSFKAKKALFNKADNILEMQKDVVIETADGLCLETDKIKWDQNRDKVSTDAAVKITRQNEIEVQGIGLDAQPSLKKATIAKAVEVVIPQEDSEAITVSCNGPLEIDYQQGMAVFKNNVKITQQDSQLFSDKATMYFDLDVRSIEKMIAVGNVRIVRDKNTSYSDKATYDALSKKVVLEGAPKLVIFPDNSQNLFE